MEKAKIGFGTYLYGYVNGDRYLVSNTVEQICAFIMKFRFDNVKIVDLLDQLEIETSMGFLQFVRNQVFLRETLQPTLVPMQMGEVEIVEFIPHSIQEDYVINNVRMKSTEGYFLGALGFEEKSPRLIDKQSGYFQTEEDINNTFPTSISDSKAKEIATVKGWL